MSNRYRLTLNGMFRDDDGDWVKYEESIADKLKRKGYTKPKHSAYHDALANSGYVCPCPDGCNGCEVPDFAIKEIERLTADLNESERQTRAQLKRVLQRDEWERLWKKASVAVIDLQDEVARLKHRGNCNGN